MSNESPERASLQGFWKLTEGSGMNRIASADPQRIAIEFFASFRRMLEALQGQERIMIGLSGGASLS